MTSPMPNLYEIHGLDRSATCEELGREIAARDLELDQQLIDDTDPRRRQLQTAFAVLADQSRRATYDDALTASLRLSWEDLEYLGNFGTFPDASMRPGPQPGYQPQPGPDAYGYPTYSPEAPQPGATHNPFDYPSSYVGPSPAVQGLQGYGAVAGAYVDRPSAMKRLGMLFIDGLMFSLVTSVLLIGIDTDAAFGAMLTALLGAAWFLGFEVLTGASPTKHAFGYEVRDRETGDKLTWGQSAKRQWWRLINIVPGIGSLISFIGMIVIGISIKEENGFIGAHDRWAGAEVARKSGR
ncbi:RDD family protein [Corynebacterium sp.]|uniref:RDD family protein n=1 Tax=Corynebacterium sp. TaxID=1720 RepID=UPI0026E0CCD6|nr:RDD family protein [Corynebacterium sp.]MDO5512971.1 RDD family protein [Corynebacterium sp.]